MLSLLASWPPALLLLRLLLTGCTAPRPCRCSSSCRRLLQQRWLATCCNCILLLLLPSQLPSVVMMLQVPAVLVLQLLLVLVLPLLLR
jgi:hypothetical protein